MKLLKTRPGSTIRNNSNWILAGGSILGFFVTVVLVARSQKKVDDAIAAAEEYKKENGDICPEDEDTEEPDEVKPFKYFIPPAISGVITIACIIGGNYISWKKIVSLTGTVSFLIADRNNLERRLREKFGDEVVDEIKKRVVNDRFSSEKEPVVIYKEVSVEPTGFGNTLFYDMESGRLFRCSPERIEYGFECMKDTLNRDNMGSVNDIHTYWGLRDSEAGSRVGWFFNSYIMNTQKDGSIKHKTYTAYNEDLKEDMICIQFIDEPEFEYWSYE